MANITVKGIPDDLYERLKEQAEEHRRSINQEIIRCLERYVGRERESGEEWLERIDELRVTPEGGPLEEDEVQWTINRGRE